MVSLAGEVHHHVVLEVHVGNFRCVACVFLTTHINLDPPFVSQLSRLSFNRAIIPVPSSALAMGGL
jgi:hypothetical protein